MPMMTVRQLFGSQSFLGGQIRVSVRQQVWSEEGGKTVELVEIWLGHIYESNAFEKEGGQRLLDLTVAWFARKALAIDEWRRDLHEEAVVRCSLDAEVRDIGGYGLWEVKVEPTMLRFVSKATLIFNSDYKAAYYPPP